MEKITKRTKTGFIFNLFSEEKDWHYIRGLLLFIQFNVLFYIFNHEPVLFI